ncbi:uncharacterized protein LOC34618646 [Cyclospora cayetanensis]|uniref:Uncharacterized protein LOC34618646 n=1 Tax=Cyclospora cayetanensis TaxID=88456 RepID=A0A6P5WDR5_9EIME|nr:uncharacterized protein LOC34618646 [Cyclospora cayetanensis]
MTEVSLDGLGFLGSPESLKEPTAKRSSANASPVRFSLPLPGDGAGSPVAAATTNQRKSCNTGGSVQSRPSGAAERNGTSGSASTGIRKPTVLVGADGRPLSILKSRQHLDYAHVRRLAEQLRVKFAFDRNETRFYCPDSNEHMEPRPAPAELRTAVRGFLKTSKRIVQEAKQLSQTALQQVEDSKHFEEELMAMTQVYVHKLEERQKAKTSQMIVVAQPKTQRRSLCCGGALAVLP